MYTNEQMKTITYEQFISRVTAGKRGTQMNEKENAQKKFCKENKIPCFAQRFCDRCFKNPYDGYTLEQCGKYHITSCPHCRKSFID